MHSAFQCKSFNALLGEWYKLIAMVLWNDKNVLRKMYHFSQEFKKNFGKDELCEKELFIMHLHKPLKALKTFHQCFPLKFSSKFHQNSTKFPLCYMNIDMCISSSRYAYCGFRHGINDHQFESNIKQEMVKYYYN